MRIARHFYITTLPALGELGGAVPMGLADLIEHVGEHRQLREQVEAVVLLDDLMQRESLLAGEVEEVEPAVLSQQQARGEAPLPEALAPPPGGEPADWGAPVELNQNGQAESNPFPFPVDGDYELAAEYLGDASFTASSTVGTAHPAFLPSRRAGTSTPGTSSVI